MAAMSSFNRIGAKWTGGDYRLLTEILRNEWGFKGMVITDFNTTTYGNLKQMAYAGGDLNLGKCVKNILYTVANSNALNGEVDHYNLAWWKILVITLDCVVVAGVGVWGFFAVRKAIKSEEKESNT